MRNERRTSSVTVDVPAVGADLRLRTKAFALSMIALYGRLPDRTATGVIKKQMLRSGTSIGAQYREACRARSTAEFISKMESSLQEIDETGYWLELLRDAKLADAGTLLTLLQEVDELIRIFVASITTAKGRH